MKLIFSIFSSSPLEKLELHMKHVAVCIQILQKMIPHLLDRNYDELEKMYFNICQLKQIGDLAKQRIEKSISSSLFLPVKRRAIIRCLNTQQKISNKTQKIARLFSVVPNEINENVEKCFEDFFIKTTTPFQRVLEVVFEFKELQVSSFGGSEAAKVSFMVETIMIMVKEYESELKDMLKNIYTQNTTGTAAYWSHILMEMEPMSLLSEKMAHLIKMMLEQ